MSVRTPAHCTMQWDGIPCANSAKSVVMISCTNDHHHLNKRMELCPRCLAQVWTVPGIKCECGGKILFASRPMPMGLMN